MGGLAHAKINLDPAILKIGDVSTNRYKYFRWTKRTAWISFVYMVAVPTMLGVVAYSTDGKYNLRAKRRGDTILEY